MKRLSAYFYSFDVQQLAVYLFTFSTEIHRKQVYSGWFVSFFGNDIFPDPSKSAALA